MRTSGETNDSEPALHDTATGALDGTVSTLNTTGNSSGSSVRVRQSGSPSQAHLGHGGGGGGRRHHHGSERGAGSPPAAASLANSSKTNIFVRNLPHIVGDELLREIFSPFGNIVSSVIMRNIYTGESLGTAFVRYSTHLEARIALESLRNMHISFCHTPPPTGAPPACFAGAPALAPVVTLGPHGSNVVSINVPQFRLKYPACTTPLPDAEEADQATFKERMIVVQWADRSHDSAPTGEARRRLRKIFIRNIPADVNTDMFRALFGRYGIIKDVSLHKDTTSHGEAAEQQRRIGFVSFADEGVAEVAAKAVHNTKPFPSCGGIPLMVKVAEDTPSRHHHHSSSNANANNANGGHAPTSARATTEGGSPAERRQGGSSHGAGSRRGNRGDENRRSRRAHHSANNAGSALPTPSPAPGLPLNLSGLTPHGLAQPIPFNAAALYPVSTMSSVGSAALSVTSRYNAAHTQTNSYGGSAYAGSPRSQMSASPMYGTLPIPHGQSPAGYNTSVPTNFSTNATGYGHHFNLNAMNAPQQAFVPGSNDSWSAAAGPMTNGCAFPSMSGDNPSLLSTVNSNNAGVSDLAATGRCNLGSTYDSLLGDTLTTPQENMTALTNELNERAQQFRGSNFPQCKGSMGCGATNATGMNSASSTVSGPTAAQMGLLEQLNGQYQSNLRHLAGGVDAQGVSLLSHWETVGSPVLAPSRPDQALSDGSLGMRTPEAHRPTGGYYDPACPSEHATLRSSNEMSEQPAASAKTISADRPTADSGTGGTACTAQAEGGTQSTSRSSDSDIASVDGNFVIDFRAESDSDADDATQYVSPFAPINL